MKLSWSRLSTYDKCPRMLKYMLDHVPYVEDKRNAILGIVVQRVFELWINSKEYLESGPDWLYQNFDRIFDECLSKETCAWETPYEAQEKREETRRQIDQLLTVFHTETLLVKKIKSEHKFDVEIASGIVVRGSIDFVLKRGTGHMYILDAKGSKYGTRYLDPRQLVLYKAAMIAQHGEKWADAECAWILFRTRRYFVVDSYQEQLDDLLEFCNKVNNGIQNKQFDPTPGSACRRCNWRDQCEDRVGKEKDNGKKD